VAFVLMLPHILTYPFVSSHLSCSIASFPGHIPLCSLDRMWPLNHPEKREKAYITSISSKCKVDSIMTFVDLVSVIMATFPRPLLHILVG